MPEIFEWMEAIEGYEGMAWHVLSAGLLSAYL